MDLDHDPLAVDADTMRRQGYAMVDFVVDHLTTPYPPALVRASPGEMATRIPAAPPAGPEDFDTILRHPPHRHRASPDGLPAADLPRRAFLSVLKGFAATGHVITAASTDRLNTMPVAANDRDDLFARVPLFAQLDRDTVRDLAAVRACSSANEPRCDQGLREPQRPPPRRGLCCCESRATRCAPLSHDPERRGGKEPDKSRERPDSLPAVLSNNRPHEPVTGPQTGHRRPTLRPRPDESRTGMMLP
jgi:hypothetical protein